MLGRPLLWITFYLVSWIPGYVNNLLGKKADLVTSQAKTVMLFLSEFIKVMLDRKKI